MNESGLTNMADPQARLKLPAFLRAFRRPIQVGGVAAVLAAAALTVSAQSSDFGASRPLYTAKPRFRIPFQFDAAEMQRLGASEIQLHVSTDRGASWSQEQTVEPSAGRFSFEAPTNGEFWFAVRTIDRNQKQYPEGALQTGLRVVVDSVAPAVTLNVEPLGRDRVSLSWDVADENLDLGTLKIEWRDETSAAWQPLSFLAAPTGQTSWTTRGQVEVRASVSDLAGNEGSAADDSSPVGTTPPSIAAPPFPTRSFPAEPAESEPDFSKPVAQAPQLPLPETPPSIVAPAPFQTAERPEVSAYDSLPIIRSRRDLNQLTAPPQAVPVPTVPLMVGQPVSAPAPSVMQDRWGGPAASGNWSGADQQPATVATPSIRTVQSRSFKVGYQVDAAAAQSVTSVDLYITEDGGQKWFHYGIDPDGRSPFDVVVPRDGHYGFSIRVQGPAGSATVDPPQPGDAPDIRIVVDQAPPVAQLFPPRQGQGASQNQVLIEWNVQDQQLAERPVALSYSSNPNGPWQSITDWTENTGRFVWTLPEGSASRVYVKLDARDAAGNLTQAHAHQPVVVDSGRPSARIVDVESTARPAPQ